MRKQLKVSAAGAVTVALLAGGAGTFARWYDTHDLSGADMSAGGLGITAVTDGEWVDAAGTAVNPDDFLLVPGDTVTFTRAYEVTAKGDHLDAVLSVDLSGMVPSGEGSDELLAALEAASTVTFSGTDESGDGSGAAGWSTVSYTSNDHAITEDYDGDVITVSVAVNFPLYEDAAVADPADMRAFEERAGWWGDDAQLQSVSLGGVTVDLVQAAGVAG